MSIQAVIFDLDGTLLDTLGDLTAAVNHALRKRGYAQLTEDGVCARVGNGVRQLIAQSLPAGEETQIAECLHDFQTYYEAHLVERTHPYVGIVQLIAALRTRGIRLAVLSNKYDAAAKRLIAHYFPQQILYTFGERPHVPRKPDPTATHELLSLLQVQKEEVLYIGDSDVDMQTAKQAGVTAVGVLWGFRGRECLLESGADYLVETPEALRNLVDRLQLDSAIAAFESRGFACTFCATAAQAADYLQSQCTGQSVALGGSMTLEALGIYERLQTCAKPHWHWKGDGFCTHGDVYLTSANALAATGEIFNIDGACNRIAGSVYGFSRCYVVCGIQKLTPDLLRAMERARMIAAPRNAKRLNKRTPCAVDGKCHDCRSPERICRAMNIVMAPPSHMQHYEIILVGETLGY